MHLGAEMNEFLCWAERQLLEVIFGEPGTWAGKKVCIVTD